MRRRDLLVSGAVISGAAAAAAAIASDAVPGARLGVASTCYMTVRRPTDTLEFLEYCHALGAGGVQAPLASFDPAYTRRVRQAAGERGMYFEVMLDLPGLDLPRLDLPGPDTGAFERAVEAAKAAGARAARAACLRGRRYETFQTIDEWKTFAARSQSALDRALPILEKHKLPLAVENHKDWTAAELAAILKARSSEYLGANIDTGNNLALLEEPLYVVRTLAPYAVATHLKDMAAAPYADGFLLAEVPLGTGMLDIGAMVRIIREARPAVPMTLEMITRDPLRVPCLTEKYRATFPDRGGQRLAGALALARENAARPMPALAGLNRAAQLKLEDDNVRECLRWAHARLNL